MFTLCSKKTRFLFLKTVSVDRYCLPWTSVYWYLFRRNNFTYISAVMINTQVGM